jgi:tetratricopeptide (TPR) repeat protein
MRRCTVIFRAARVALALVAAACAGCVTKPRVATEADSGRPALTWTHEGSNASPASRPDADQEIEQRLRADEREAEHTSDDVALAASLYNLAILRREQGKLPEAEGLYRRSLEIRERVEGADHPDVATTLNNLAGLKAAQGDYDAAQPLLERALAIRQAALGDEHTLTAESLSNLALLYAARGNAAAAEPLYQRALSILEKPGGEAERRDDLGRVLDNYAALLYETGRDGQAVEIEERARILRAAAVKR